MINKEFLSTGEIIWSPENMQTPEKMAFAMMDILTPVYGQHNLMSNIEELSAQIKIGQVIPWIKLDDNSIPLACAALIDHGDRVEIGRAANHPINGGCGGKLMELACKWHQKHDKRPLVAEIRMAKTFEGIQGGQGSQHVLLNKLKFVPHAFIPAFHHPGPFGLDRQELFGFATLPNTNERWKKNEFHPTAQVVLPNSTFHQLEKRHISFSGDKQLAGKVSSLLKK